MSAQNPSSALTNSFNIGDADSTLSKFSTITELDWTKGRKGVFLSGEYGALKAAEYQADEWNKKFGDNSFFSIHKATLLGGYFGLDNPHQIVISVKDAISVIERQEQIDLFYANRQKAQDMLVALSDYTHIDSWEQRWSYDDEPIYDCGKIPFTTNEVLAEYATKACNALNILFDVDYFEARNTSSNIDSLKAVCITEEDIVKLDVEKLTSATSKLAPPAPIVI